MCPAAASFFRAPLLPRSFLLALLSKLTDKPEKLLAHPNTNYLQINSTTAGCFTFRIERASAQ
jgi:hypothetical protein